MQFISLLCCCCWYVIHTLFKKKTLHSTHLDPIRLTISLCINTSVNTITLSLLLWCSCINILSFYHIARVQNGPYLTHQIPPKVLAITHMWNVEAVDKYKRRIYAWHLCIILKRYWVVKKMQRELKRFIVLNKKLRIEPPTK